MVRRHFKFRSAGVVQIPDSSSSDTNLTLTQHPVERDSVTEYRFHFPLTGKIQMTADKRKVKFIRCKAP